MTKNKVCLVVIDGWGISPESSVEGNAIANAKTPVMTQLRQLGPSTALDAHGLAVGLPDGLMGNSEVGHLNIGAGRVVYQDIIRIDLALQDGSIKQAEALQKPFSSAGNPRVHLLGLVSDGGVHSHIRHLKGLLNVCKEAGISETFVHMFSDGRDTRPCSVTEYYEDLSLHINSIKYGKIASIMGRYYAMDRDKRWERTQIAYEALVAGRGEYSMSALETIRQRYANNETDEFFTPMILNRDGMIRDTDVLIFFNFRADRMRQLAQAFACELPFTTEVTVPRNLSIVSMTRYSPEFSFPVIFPPQEMSQVLAECLASHRIPQYHVAETEKYAHVTFFFNGGVEPPFDLEERKMIPSPKVATYDLQPEMSVRQVGECVCQGIESGRFPFIMCNLAPPDMVGHTGMLTPTIQAVEATDETIGKIRETCRQHGYVLFVTADHGNAEKMINEKGGPHTAHTTAQVPFYIDSPDVHFRKNVQGALCDVAPTILDLMGIPIPTQMTGKSLIDKSPNPLTAASANK